VKYRETRDAHLLSACKIGAMLQLAELVEQPGITSLYLSVEDGEPIPEDLLQQGVEFVVAERERGNVVLIACGAGISRSAAFAVAALKEVEGLNLLEAMRVVKEQHPTAMPHPDLWESLCAYYREDFPYYDAQVRET
jgi:protein-tyrosine phosphatase